MKVEIIYNEWKYRIWNLLEYYNNIYLYIKIKIIILKYIRLDIFKLRKISIWDLKFKKYKI